MNQFKPDTKVGLLGSSSLASLMVPRIKAREITCEKETERKGKRKRASVHSRQKANSERGREVRRRVQPKCLDYIGGRRSPDPGLKSRRWSAPTRGWGGQVHFGLLNMHLSSMSLICIPMLKTFVIKPVKPKFHLKRQEDA